jgi:D-sedoheptulose 7-phosphate isomerase
MSDTLALSSIEAIISESLDVKKNILTDATFKQNIWQAVQIIERALKSGNKILFCGNGGSAADAQHLAAEFSGRFYKDRKALPAEALHVNTSYLTAVANDYGFDAVYARLIEGIGAEGDILICLTTSGNSENVVKAAKTAIEKNLYVIGFTGKTGGLLREHVGILFNVPSENTPRIQECHILIGHIICQLVEEKYFQ